MKRITAFMIVFAMTLSLAACGAPAETAQTDTAQTAQATETPTEEPTPTLEPEPTPTPEPEYTEAEKIWNSYLLMKENKEEDPYIYALLSYAYNNSLLDEMTEKGEITNVDWIQSTLPIVLEDYSLSWEHLFPAEESEKIPVEKLSVHEIVIKVLRVDNLKMLTEDVEFFIGDIIVRLQKGHDYLSAMPEERREKLQTMMDLFNNITSGDNLQKFEEKINGGYLDSLEKWYLDMWIKQYNIENQAIVDPIIEVDGQSIAFSEYAKENNFFAFSYYGVLKYMKEHHLAEGCEEDFIAWADDFIIIRIWRR